MAYQHNGVSVDIKGEITIDGIQFPAGFFEDEQERVRYGITWVDDLVYPDPNFWTWANSTSGKLYVYPKPVADVKALLVTLAKALRDSKKISNGFKIEVDGEAKWFHSDVFSRGQQQTLFSKAQVMLVGGAAASEVLPIPAWRTMDGTYVQLTIQNVLDIIDSGIASDGALFKACVDHETAVDAISGVDDTKTVAALEAYDLTKGWPKGFGEA